LNTNSKFGDEGI